MFANLLLIAAAGIGVDVGWKPTADGRIEYIIQVTPEELQNLDLGDIIAASDVPSNLPPIAAYRVVVGRSPLLRELPNRSPANADQETIAKQFPGAGDSNNVGYEAQPVIALFPSEPKQLPSPSSDIAAESGVGQDGQSSTRSGGLTTENRPAVGKQSDATGFASGEGEKTSGRWQTIWIIITTLFAVCVAVTMFTLWAVADYRRKYRLLMEKLDSEGGLLNTPQNVCALITEGNVSNTTQSKAET
ncbi:MAG: hypothetical protein ACUVQG_05585 [Thermogutta sp.]